MVEGEAKGPSFAAHACAAAFFPSAAQHQAATALRSGRGRRRLSLLPDVELLPVAVHLPRDMPYLGHTVLIDEPDAYLHPNLSRRLELALEEGVGPKGQLIVATHSPAILDGMPPSGILRLEHGSLPRRVTDDRERLDLYREAGFKSSDLTQADLLVVVEGTSDAALLTLAVPELGRASIHAAGGRARALRTVEQLMPFDLPVVGVVDSDLRRTPLPTEIADNVLVWPSSDIEGVYLGSMEALDAMIDLGLIKSQFPRAEDLRALVTRLCSAQRENVVAEIVRADLVSLGGYEWPTPRGNDPLGRLRQAGVTCGRSRRWTLNRPSRAPSLSGPKRKMISCRLYAGSTSLAHSRRRPPR